jgi:hypothetical protein
MSFKMLRALPLLASGLVLAPQLLAACDQSGLAPSATEQSSENLCNPNAALGTTFCHADTDCCQGLQCHLFANLGYGMCCGGGHELNDGDQNPMLEPNSCCTEGIQSGVFGQYTVCCSMDGQVCSNDTDCCLPPVGTGAGVHNGPPNLACGTNNLCCAVKGQPCPVPGGGVVNGQGGSCCGVCDTTAGAPGHGAVCATCIPLTDTGCAKTADCCAGGLCDTTATACAACIPKNHNGCSKTADCCAGGQCNGGKCIPEIGGLPGDAPLGTPCTPGVNACGVTCSLCPNGPNCPQCWAPLQLTCDPAGSAHPASCCRPTGTSCAVAMGPSPCCKAGACTAAGNCP